MSLRDIKAQARTDLHNGMQVRIAYYETAASPALVTRCRVLSKVEQAGELKGTNLSYAETVETIPTLIFLLADNVPVARNAIIVVASDEGYQIDHIEPTDVVTVTAKAKRMRAEEFASLLPPPSEGT